MMFRTVGQVLTFAYGELASSILKVSSYKDTERTTGEVLSPQDAHTQAVFVVEQIAAILTEREMLYIQTQFGGYKEVDGLRGLAYLHIMADIKNISSRGLAYDLAQRYFFEGFRKSTTLRRLAYDHGTSLRTLERRENEVTGYLNNIWFEAEAKADAHFIRNGLIAS